MNARRLRPLVVGAIAVADRRANVVGPVRLSCEADTMRLELLRVGRFAAGFAFIGLAQAITFRVPYTAVRGLVRDGHTLHLAIDPVVAAPFNRFVLTRFSRDPHSALMSVFRMRSLVSMASKLLPLPLAALAAWVLPTHLAAGSLGTAAVALVVAFASWRALRWLVDWLSWGGPESDRLRSAFEHTVAAHLGLEPVAELAEEPAVLLAPDLAEPPRPTLGQVLGTVLRPIAFGAVAMVAIGGAVGAVMALQRYGVAEMVLLPVDEAERGVAAPARGITSAAVALGTPDAPLCRCERVHAAMWNGGLPQVSIVISPGKGRIDNVWVQPAKTYPLHFAEHEEEGEVELELAVINNSTEPVTGVDLVVTFARRGPRGERRNLRERGLSWPRELRPGEAVRWHVEATGSELKVDTKLAGRLGEGGVTVAAPAKFEALRDASLGAVRLHGAMMLAYLRHPSTRSYATALTHLTSLEQQRRAAIVGTLTPLAVCDVTPSKDGVTLCLYNGSEQLHRGMRVTEVGADAPRSWSFEDLFIAGYGLQLSIPSGSEQPDGFDVEPFEPR